MTRIDVPANAILLVNGSRFKVVCHTSSNELHLSNIETGLPLLISTTGLIEKIMEGEAEFAEPSTSRGRKSGDTVYKSFEAFSEEERAVARRRLLYVKCVDQHLANSSMKTAIRDAAKEMRAQDQSLNPSDRTIIRWYESWISGGRDIRALLAKNYCKGRKPYCIGDRVCRILYEAMEDHYLVREHVTVEQLFNIVRDRIKRENQSSPRGAFMKVPSKRTIYRFVKRLDPYEVMTAQKGRNVADQAFAPVQSGLAARYPLHIVQVDHHLMDVILRLSTGEELGRPWLTVALDLYSRMIVGFRISFDPPGYVSVMHCLRQAVLPKDKFLAQVLWEFKAQSSVENVDADFESEWPCFGLMDCLVLDNGLEFHSQSLLDSAAQLGVSVQYCPARKPNYKGAVERFFGTLNTRLIHTLPGTTFSNPIKKGDYPSSKRACLTIEDLEFLITKFIVDEYAYAHHTGIDDRPIARWLAGTDKHPVRVVDNLLDVSIFLSKIEERTLSRTGITIKGLAFQSEAIQVLYRRLMHNSNKSVNPKVRIKVNPDDMSTIYVEDAPNRVFLPAKCIYDTYSYRLSIWRHALIRKALRDQRKRLEECSEDELLEVRQTLFEVSREIIKDRQKRKRKRANRIQDEERKAGFEDGPWSQLTATEPEPGAPFGDDQFEIPFMSPEEIDEEISKRGWNSSDIADNRAGGEVEHD
jgi:putative transposase